MEPGTMPVEAGDIITLSDREYVVQPDGSWRVNRYLDSDESGELQES